MLEGRVSIVTGSSRDMGRGIAMHLASLGSRLAIHYARARDAALDTVAAIHDRGGEAEAFQADLTDPEAASEFVGAVVERFGALDVLVCNVGGYMKKPFVETTVDDWNGQFALNTGTMFNCAHAAVPRMQQQKFGRIVNFGAAGAELVPRQTGYTAYAAAKAAVVAFSRALAKEVAPDGITVNVVAPGVISENAPTRDAAREIGFVKHTPVGRVGSFVDVAEAVGFLVRPDADYITGAVLDVGGGWRI